MIWFFVITSVVFALVGILMLITPQQMLFLMSDAENQRLMEGRYHPLISRIGGVLIVFVCVPLNLIIGLLFAGFLTT